MLNRSKLLAGSFLFISLFIAAPASAHDWYPMDCCHGMDCAPVDRVELIPGADMLVTSKHGTTLVPSTFPTRESKDHRMHVCMRQSGPASMRPICLFLPPMT